MNADRYISVSGQAESRTVISRSEFIGYSFYAPTENKAQDFLAAIKKKHYDATHNCYAYITDGGNAVKSFDDGEPSGTAGQPILEVLRQRKVCDTIVIVTRYFGGVKLGAGGLVRAYSASCAKVLDISDYCEHINCAVFEISLSYEQYSAFNQFISNTADFFVTNTEYGENIAVTAAVPLQIEKQQVDKLCGYMQGKIDIRRKQSGFIKRKINI